MADLNLCPMCGAPAPARPPLVCRYCSYAWATPSQAPPPPSPAKAHEPPSTPAPPALVPAPRRFVPLDEATVVQACHRALDGFTDVFFAPDIPGRKLANAREAHQNHLPPDEKVLVLFDATVFGAADDGFVVTQNRFCWKNVAMPSAAMPWRAIDPSTIGVSGHNVSLMHAELQAGVQEGFADRVAALVREIASMAREGEPAGVDPTDLLRRVIGVHADMHYAPVPAKKEANARAVHAAWLPADEPVLALLDDTLFGGGDDGLVFTTRRLCFRQYLEQPGSIAWVDVPDAGASADGSTLFVGAHKVGLSNKQALLPRLAQAITEMGKLARGR